MAVDSSISLYYRVVGRSKLVAVESSAERSPAAPDVTGRRTEERAEALRMDVDARVGDAQALPSKMKSSTSSFSVASID